MTSSSYALQRFCLDFLTLLKSKLQTWTKKDYLCMSVLFLILLGVGVYSWLVLTWHQPTKDGRVLDVKFPVTSENVIIDSCRTIWKPVWNGQGQFEEYLPCLTITLAENSPAVSRDLHVVIQNSAGDYVGDTSSVRIQNGKFEKTQSHQVMIVGSAGLPGKAGFAEYKGGGNDLWKGIVFVQVEGKTPTKACEFVLLPTLDKPVVSHE